MSLRGHAIFEIWITLQYGKYHRVNTTLLFLIKLTNKKRNREGLLTSCIKIDIVTKALMLTVNAKKYEYEVPVAQW